jgi:hypothetical protein
MLGMAMNASLINALCHYVLWAHECSTVREYEEKLNEAAASMGIERIVFVGGFDDIQRGVWDERLDGHLHHSPVFDRVEPPFETMAPLAPFV